MKHIAILRQPFYDMILNGEKTIESRWSMRKIAPYNKIKRGDVIYLKKSGGKIGAKAHVAEVGFYKLTFDSAKKIIEQYGEQLGAEKFENIYGYLNKKYATLIWLDNVEKIPPMDSPKSHGAGWLILKD